MASDAEARRALDHKVIEMMTAELAAAATRSGSALALAANKAAAVIGPGLGLDARDAASSRARSRVELPLPCVLDADALTALGSELGRAARGARGRACSRRIPARPRGCSAAAALKSRRDR